MNIRIIHQIDHAFLNRKITLVRLEAIVEMFNSVKEAFMSNARDQRSLASFIKSS